MRRGTGNVHRNINCRVFGINPYNTYKYEDTLFGRFIFVTSPLLEEAYRKHKGEASPNKVRRTIKKGGNNA